ncbi:MAG: DUF47 family protein [Bacillota bacterium]|nr:DUF47 family protein [Bacillota bacterium]
MSKKTENFYFENFKSGVSFAKDAAKMLKSIFEDFDPKKLNHQIEEMHKIEHSADEKKHELMNALTVAFITPLEREDIIKLSQFIDDVTDSIEDILIHIYFNNITELREDAMEFADILLKCCDSLEELLEEFKNFKKSKKLGKIIIEINRLEEDGDELYVKAMRNLHTNSQNMFEIIVWREIYTMFEFIYDGCEHVADVVESVAIGNT